MLRVKAFETHAQALHAHNAVVSVDQCYGRSQRRLEDKDNDEEILVLISEDNKETEMMTQIQYVQHLSALFLTDSTRAGHEETFD